MPQDYTKELLKKGAERVRLTKQLQEMLLQVAEDIATSVPLGTEVEVAGVRYRTHRYNSNIGSFCTVVIVDPGSVKDFPLYRAIDNEPPGSEYYLHRDYGRIVHVATRKEFLHFANHLPEIIRAFEVKEEEIIKELRSAFERLQKLAE